MLIDLSMLAIRLMLTVMQFDFYLDLQVYIESLTEKLKKSAFSSNIITKIKILPRTQTQSNS